MKLFVFVLLLSSAREVVASDLVLPVLSCVQSVLTDRGESIFRVNEEQGVVSTSFRIVGPEVLQHIAIPNRRGGRVRWTKGMYQLSVFLSFGEEGRPQVRVRARILGAGETSLPLMRPSAWWPLPSTGSLESDVLAALTARCGVTP